MFQHSKTSLCCQTVSKSGVLSETEMRPFWVSWSNRTISVGEGTTVGEREFLSWSNSTLYPITFVAISTGWEATGLWQFSHLEGLSNKMHV